MTSTIYLDDGPQKPANSVLQPSEQEVKESDRFSSPQRLGITAVAAVTPDSADRASGGSRATRAKSPSSEGSSEFAGSRLHELRSQRNAKLGALKERIKKTSHNTRTTTDTALAKSRSDSSSHWNSEADIDSIHSGSGNSAHSRHSGYHPSPRIEELRAKRQQRLNEYRSRSPSAKGALPQVITLNGADVQAPPLASKPLVKASDQHAAFSTSTTPSPLRQYSVPRFDRRTPGRHAALRRRSSAPNIYKGITEEMLDDEMLSGLSKLDRLRLRRAQIHQKAQMAKAAVSRSKEDALNEQLGKQLRDVRKERANLQKELEVSKAALQRAREEKLSGTKAAAGAENDTFGLCNMVDDLQGQVDKLEDNKIEDDIRVDEALHDARLEVAQLREQLEETQLNLSQIRRENQELTRQNQQQQARHSDVTKMWEHRVEGLVSQIRDVQISLQDLSQARLEERSDLLRHIVLLQKENQRLRHGGVEKDKTNQRLRFWKPGAATSFGKSFTFMPFGSLLGGRHRTLKVTGDTWHLMKPASKSKTKSQGGVSTFLKRCSGLMAWESMKNVAFGAGIMGLVLMSGDPQLIHDPGPCVRLEISKPLFKLA